MKALILDAARADDAATTGAADALEARLGAHGYDVERTIVRELDVRACTGCFGCWTKTPGQCVIDDDARRVSERIINSDVTVVVTPISFGCYGSMAKGLLDRQICLILPYFTMVDGEVHHKLRYSRYPKWLALGTLRESCANEEATFRQLVARNAKNMHDPGHAAEIVVGNEPPDRPVDRLLAAAGIATEVLA